MEALEQERLSMEAANKLEINKVEAKQILNVLDRGDSIPSGVE